MTKTETSQRQVKKNPKFKTFTLTSENMAPRRYQDGLVQLTKGQRDFVRRAKRSGPPPGYECVGEEVVAYVDTIEVVRVVKIFKRI